MDRNLDALVQLGAQITKNPHVLNIDTRKLNPGEPLLAPVMNFGDGEVVQHGNPVSGLPVQDPSSRKRRADYSGQATPGHNVADEEPLLAPVMNFDHSERPKSGDPEQVQVHGRAGGDEEEPLIASRMEF